MQCCPLSKTLAPTESLAMTQISCHTYDNLDYWNFQSFQEEWFSGRLSLENPRDGGAWWTAVYGVAQSRTRLKQLSNSSSSKETSQCLKFQIQPFLYVLFHGPNVAAYLVSPCNSPINVMMLPFGVAILFLLNSLLLSNSLPTRSAMEELGVLWVFCAG